MKNIFLIVLLCFCITKLYAQTIDESILLNDVVITENRIEIPFSDVSRNISIITKKEIEQLNAASVNEVLQQIAGVDVRQRGIAGVQADVSVRGGTFEQTLILINGVKIIDPQTGHHLMNLPINVEDIERVEVLKGPAARIYGQNAFAGAINIITKAKKDHNLFFNAELGNFGFRNYHSNLAFNNKNSSNSLSFSKTKSNGYRHNTDFDILNINFQNQTKVLNGKLDFFAGYSDRSFGANGFYGNENFTEQFETIQTAFASLALTQKINSWKIVPKIAYRRNVDNWQFLRSNPEVFQNFHTTDVVSGELQITKTHNLGIFGFGLDYQNINITSNNLGTHFRSQIGAHLENRFVLLENSLDITPGIFILNDNFFGTYFYPGIDVGFNLNNNFKTFANTGFTNRLPTYTDLYYEDSGNIGNENLKPESALTNELGFKFNNKKTNLVVSIFNRTTNNLMDWYKDIDTSATSVTIADTTTIALQDSIEVDNRWQIDNFTKANYFGLDVSLKIKNPTNFINSLIVNYQFLDVSFDSNSFALSRNELENLRHQFIVSPSFKITENCSANFLYKYIARESLENYTTVDVNFKYTEKNIDFYFKASNLFNKIYRETNLVEMPGRWLKIGATVKIK